MNHSAPCTYSLEPAVDCLPTSSLDTSPLWPSSGTPTAAKSCASEPPMDGSPACECTKETFGCSIHPNTPEAWIASQRDSLAKTLALLERELVSAKEPEAGFTAKSCVSLASFDPATSGWKTSQQSFLCLEPSRVTWPLWGMTAAGVAYAHPQSERRIIGIAGGASADWPTPRANDAEKRGQIANDPRNGLPAAVMHCPTPSSTDWKRSSKPGQRRGQLTDPAMGVIPAGGRLNPAWDEWLMGWPTGMTALPPSETAKSRSKPQPPGESLADPERVEVIE